MLGGSAETSSSARSTARRRLGFGIAPQTAEALKTRDRISW